MFIYVHVVLCPSMKPYYIKQLSPFITVPTFKILPLLHLLLSLPPNMPSPSPLPLSSGSSGIFALQTNSATSLGLLTEASNNLKSHIDNHCLILIYLFLNQSHREPLKVGKGS